MSETSAPPRSWPPPVRSTAPTPAAWRSGWRTAGWSRWTAPISIRSPTATSAPRSGSFPEHLYGAGPAALSRRAQRAQGRGRVRARSPGTRRWTSRRRRSREARERDGGEAILPFCYGGSNGLLTPGHHRRPALPPARRLAPRPHGLRRADRAARRRGSTARWPGVAYQDYLHARLIVLWGVNPSASGIHLVPHPPGGAAPGSEAGGDRSAPHAARQEGGPASRSPAGHATWPSRSRCIR